ncbi:uncharacterized protein BHQ10_004659 [Talaromyces amestolkiae]|uniref:Uncharacterized protein n=1 Tax=Talaromyces amestolkiae TaxID=1196081 RepID=A0A364KYL0_TALAM|nr:uncharacterized protein BHQ10_004659 [Talaromyces amestolkiae]RAO68647.1 hypothetical protein BHQ10_004659 [Talaromyces amestolkiae]
MEPSMASELVVKPDQNELLQMHSMPPWKRYESEEEDVSETGSQSVFSPTEGDLTHESDADSVNEAEYVDAEMLAPAVYQKLTSDDSSSLYSHRLSIITAKRSSAATCVPTQHGQDTSTDDSEDVSPLTEYMTPPVSPIYLSAVCYVPDGSESSSRDESSADAEDNDEDEVHEVSEAKQVFFTSPASKPSIVMIQSPTTEAILTARMGNPVQSQQSTDQDKQEGSPFNLRKRSSTKRSSSASGMTTPMDRSKRYSAMFYRDFTQNGEVTYSDARSHTRAQSSHSPARNSSRPRVGPRKDSLISNATDSSETRQSRPRRIPSQRSSSRGSRYAPDYESPRNYSRPRSIRSSSVASDMTSASSASWKRIHAHNWSNSSLQYPSSSSSIADQPSLSSSSSSSPPQSAGENESKQTPHPLSIITTPTSPTTASPDFQQSRFTPQQQQQPQSAITSHSSDIDWSPVEYRRSSTTPYQKTFPYSRPRNPSLSLTSALATASSENLTEYASSPRSRRGSVATTSTTTTRTRKSSISAVMSAAVGSSKSSGHSTSTMKMLMGGFRGLGKQRTNRLS